MIGSTKRHRLPRPRLEPAVRSLAGLVFPPACTLCGSPLDDRIVDIQLCAGCRKELVVPRGPLCPRCGALLPLDGATGDHCPRCAGRRLGFASVTSLGTYNGQLRRAVLRMKQSFGTSLSMAVGRLMLDLLGPSLAVRNPDVIACVPMHWTRRLVRGTNAPEVVAEVLARGLRLPAAARLLVRRRNTFAQFTLSPGQRFQNVRGAFRVGAGYHLDAARVLLVDDILTTGATCSEAAKTLCHAGAARVDVVVVARAEGK